MFSSLCDSESQRMCVCQMSCYLCLPHYKNLDVCQRDQSLATLRHPECLPSGLSCNVTPVRPGGWRMWLVGIVSPIWCHTGEREGLVVVVTDPLSLTCFKPILLTPEWMSDAYGKQSICYAQVLHRGDGFQGGSC